MLTPPSNKVWLALPARQRGIALVTALFIFSLVTIAAVAMAERQTLDMRRTENLLHYDQAYMYALGAEAWAGQLLLQDPDPAVDHYGELPEEPLVVPVDGGSIAGYIRDATARFPLNSLIDANGNERKAYVDAFQRFFDFVVSDNKCGELESFNPSLASVLLDWLDKNETPASGGAEDPAYLGLDVPHRVANHPMASISELRSLSNIIAEEYNCLVARKDQPPLVNAIPAADVTINVNTAFPEVLQSLHVLIDDAVISALMEVRNEAKEKDEAPYKDVGKFRKDLLDEITQGKTPDEITKIRAELVKIDLSVSSKYFEITSIAQIGRMQVTMISLLKRDGKKITTLRRSIGVN